MPRQLIASVFTCSGETLWWLKIVHCFNKKGKVSALSFCLWVCSFAALWVLLAPQRRDGEKSSRSWPQGRAAGLLRKAEALS